MRAGLWRARCCSNAAAIDRAVLFRTTWPDQRARGGLLTLPGSLEAAAAEHLHKAFPRALLKVPGRG